MLVAMVALREERLTRDRTLGLVLGFGGVLTVLGAWSGVAGGSRAGQLACLGATASYGVAFVYLRKFVAGRGLPALTVATAQVGLGAVAMLAATPWIARPAPDLSRRVVVSMLLLGIAGTGLAYVWNTAIVSRWGATNASTVTYLTPVVGVVLGVAVLGERATWNQPVGALLVIGGVLVAQGRLRAPTTARWRGSRMPAAPSGHAPR
jgi:drug/metabolite transporter (DMT)-like permease